MKRLLRKKVLLPCLLLVVLITLIQSTYAFYTSVGGLDNKLLTVGSEVYLQELFNPNDKWLPGETKDKVLLFGNGSERDQVIRFRVEAGWYDADGDLWNPAIADPVEIKWASTITAGTEWDMVEDAAGNKWYYYKNVLQKDEKTSAVMDAVVFSPLLSNDSLHAEDFSGSTYSLKIYLEGLDVDADIVAAEWNVEFEENSSVLSWSQS